MIGRYAVGSVSRSCLFRLWMLPFETHARSMGTRRVVGLAAPGLQRSNPFQKQTELSASSFAVLRASPHLLTFPGRSIWFLHLQLFGAQWPDQLAAYCATNRRRTISRQDTR